MKKILEHMNTNQQLVLLRMTSKISDGQPLPVLRTTSKKELAKIIKNINATAEAIPTANITETNQLIYMQLLEQLILELTFFKKDQ